MDKTRPGPVGLLLVTLLTLAACGQQREPLQAGEGAPQLAPAIAEAKNILVIGGTSGVGLETVKLALHRGHSVTAMSRHPERVTLTDDRLRLVKGDVLDPDSVEQAMAGQDVVVFSVGLPPTREPVTLFSRGTSNVLAAMAGHDVDHLLMVSGIGAGDSRGHGGFLYDRVIQPLLLKTIYEDKDRAEKLLLASDRRWTIVRPGFLDDGPGMASYRVVTEMTGITAGNISRADVAHFMLSALESNSHSGATVLLSN